MRRSGLGRGVSPALLAAFALLSLALAATLAWALAREQRAEWRVWQSRFQALGRGAPATPGGGDDADRGLQQVWLKDLDRVDRCTSCHLGIARPELRDAPQPFRAHPGRWLETHRPDRYGCTGCHGGQGEATSYRGAAHEPLAHWPEPIASRELMEARCGTCHQERRPPADWLARGRALIADRNCAACHELPGFDGDDVRAPRLDDLGAKVRPAWLRGWLRKPRAWLPKSRMGDFRLSPEDVEALTAFLLRQPRPAARLDGVDWSKADVEHGGELFRSSRCVTCHEVDGRGGTLGPDLTHVGAKASREWLYAWIRDPHRFQPQTLMPRFRFTDAEVRDLAGYLSVELGQPPAGFAESDALPDPALLAAGRRVFERRGCYSCHALEGFPALARIGPKLAGVGDRVLEPAPLRALGVAETLPNWLFARLRGPEQVLESARMPTFGFTEDEAAAVTVALLGLRARELPPVRTTHDVVRPQQEPQGDFGALVRRYRCLSCHTLGGSGYRTSTTSLPLATVALDRIGSQLRRGHIEAYLQKPIAVRVSLKERMPQLNITAAEARVLAERLATAMVDDALAGAVPGDPLTVARGRAQYEKRGCAACHIAGARGGYVGPDLNGSGARLLPGWIVAFLLEPERFKPGTLQPDYGLARDEAEALAAYVLSLPARRAKAGVR